MPHSRTITRAAICATAFALTVSLAGCGSLGGAPAAQEGDGVITFWHYYGDPHGVPLQKMLDEYTAETGVEVDARFIPFDDFNRTLQQAGAAGELPDVALINAFDTAQMADAGIIDDLSEYVEEWGEKDAYYPTGWETGQADGKTYGIPHLADVYALYYNEEILAAAGVEVPRTWDEMEAAVATIAETKAASYGLAVSGIEGAEGATGILLRTLAAGGDLSGFGGDAGVDALESFQRMTQSGGLSEGFLTWNEDDAMAAFTNGEAAMAVNSASAINVVKQNAPDMKWSVAPLPEDAKSATYLSAENLTLGAGSGDADAAWDLIAWMQKPEVLETYLPARNKLPARDDVPGAVTDPIRKTFADQLVNAWAPTGAMAQHSNEALTLVQEALQAVISGASDAEDAAKAAQSAIDEAVGD